MNDGHLQMSLSDTKSKYEYEHCNCYGLDEYPAWCGKWSSKVNESFCFLNGSLTSRFCPGVRRVTIIGSSVVQYISSDVSVCKRALRKYCFVAYL